jgi:hypothetical protein
MVTASRFIAEVHEMQASLKVAASAGLRAMPAPARDLVLDAACDGLIVACRAMALEVSEVRVRLTEAGEVAIQVIGEGPVWMEVMRCAALIHRPRATA